MDTSSTSAQSIYCMSQLILALEIILACNIKQIQIIAEHINISFSFPAY